MSNKDSNIASLRMRSFRAIDEPETCSRYLRGHVQVLEDYGITNITTNNSSWMDNSAVYGVVAESMDGKTLYGGVRVHLVDHIHPLPVEDAVGKMDSKVYKLIEEYSVDGTGELCGLWNSREVAGMGISILLVRAGISVVNQLKMDSLFTICADYTLPMVKKVGFMVEDSLGNKGEFIYPNEKYIARVLRKMNAVTLDTAHPYDRGRIFNLRNRPIQNTIEAGAKGAIRVDYNLVIPNNEA